MSDAPNENDELRAIYERHRESLVERVIEIEDAAIAALDDSLTEDERAEAERHAHKIAGSAGMFGYPKASTIARQLEYELMKDFQTDKDLPRRIASLVVELRDAVEAEPELDEEEEDELDIEKSAPATIPTLHLVTSRPTTFAELLAKAKTHGLQVQTHTHVSTIRPAPHSLTDLIMLDLSEKTNTVSTQPLADAHPPTPIIALQNNPTPEVHAQLAMQGVQAVIDASAEPKLVIDVAERMLQRRSTDNMQITVVSWDETFAKTCEHTLEGLGLRVNVARGTTELWTQLINESADLLILDMDPDDALPLHTALRRNLDSIEIPILNVIPEDEFATMQKVPVNGTEGLITKPLQEEQLIDAAILALERAHSKPPSENKDERQRESKNTPQQPPQSSMPENDKPKNSTPTDDNEEFDIMLVEDDEALAPLLLHSFEARGFRVSYTNSGSEAIHLLTTQNGTTQAPQLHAKVVVLDWDLPGASGLQVLQTISTTGVLTHTKVIMLTGRSSESEVLRALALGATDHVAKPFSVAVLMQRIESLLAATASTSGTR